MRACVRPHWSTCLAWSISFLCSLLVVGCILYFQPYWGLMDDHTNVVYLDRYRESGLWQFTLDFLRKDLNFGMVRPFYPAMVWTLWGLSGSNPTALFLVNVPFVLLALVLACWALSRPLVAWARGRHDDERWLLPPTGFLVLFTLGIFWFHDLFWFPSLQEKQVLLAVASCLAVLLRARDRQWKDRTWFPAVTAVMTLGFLTKGQFVYYQPALCLLQLGLDHQSSWRGRHPWLRYRRTASLVLIAIAGSGALQAVAAQGFYTSDFTWIHGRQQLLSPIGLAVAALATVSLVDAVHRWRHDRVPSLAALTTVLIPSLTLYAFLVVMARRGLGGYVIGGLAPALGLAVLQLCWGRARLSAIALIGLVLAAPIVTTFRNVRSFARSDDLHRIVTSPVLRDRLASGQALHVPCQEGATAMRTYLRRQWGFEPRVVWVRTRLDRNPDAQGHSLWFGDARNCVLASALDSTEVARRELLVHPNFQGGFEISELPPNPTQRDLSP